MIGPSNVADLPIIERLNYRNEFWWERAALDAFKRGRFFPILDKEGDLYLARFWLSPMIWRDGHFDSGDSLLLHWIRKADDDGALHDHPWMNFSVLLRGCYCEHSIEAGGVHRRHVLLAGVTAAALVACGGGTSQFEAFVPDIVRYWFAGTSCGRFSPPNAAWVWSCTPTFSRNTCCSTWIA